MHPCISVITSVQVNIMMFNLLDSSAIADLHMYIYIHMYVANYSPYSISTNLSGRDHSYHNFVYILNNLLQLYHLCMYVYMCTLYKYIP